MRESTFYELISYLRARKARPTERTKQGVSRGYCCISMRFIVCPVARMRPDLSNAKSVGRKVQGSEVMLCYFCDSFDALADHRLSSNVVVRGHAGSPSER